MNFSALLQYITPHRRTLLVVVLLLLASSVMLLIQPWLAGQLTTTLLTGNSALLSIGQVLGLWLALVVLRSLLAFATQYCIGSTGEVMTANLRSRLYQHMQALPLGYYQQNRTGDVLAIMSNDAEIISSFVTDTLVQLLPLLLTFTGALVMMVTIDPLIAALAIVMLPTYFVAMKLVGRRIRPISRAWIDAYSNFITYIDENLDMLPAVKAFVREPEDRRRFEVHNAMLLDLSKRQILMQSLLSPVIGLMTGLGLLLLLWLGTAHIDAGQLTPPALVSLLLYAMLLNQPLKALANVYGQVQRTRGAAERIIEFFNAQPEPSDECLPELPAIKGAISFENVNFCYPGGKPVLEKFDLHIAAGETLALTGLNGAGKSTLAHLLMRFSNPGSGRILIDDIDIAHVSLTSLRRQIGLVAQHTLLVNGTVAENIAYGLPFSSRLDIEASAHKALAHNFICSLPQGYETAIGDQGLKLSGGQRQRIALARALMLDPPILVLDEATSMFDPMSEEAFLEIFGEQLLQKTVLLITHRPASLSLADRVIDMTSNTIIESTES